jgi:tetratricopeptide (TPR) repeat protein
MQMIKLLVALIFAAVFSVNAETQPRGADRLRELVVFPGIHFKFFWGINCQNNEWVISQDVDFPGAIAEQRMELKRQPDDVKQLMHLAHLLDSNDETNESQACYQKAGQLCRNKIAVNPQDGLSLIELGNALDALGKQDEAEHDFRKATLVSPNDWKCWVGLGNFLQNDAFDSMFSEDLRNAVVPGQVPSQAVLDYRPPAETLEKSETLCNEAFRCFDRAVSLAPEEPEVFFQRAGYMSMSNLQNFYIRYYRDNEKITKNEWLSAFFSKETIANLQKASELMPKDYQYVSLAAYFEWFNAKLQNKAASFNPDTLPDAVRQFIHDSLTRLENLSEDADKKIAAGALENLGMLNMMFGNLEAATTNFRQALALDLTREQSWDLLLGTLAMSGSPEEKVAVCEAKLKYKDSAQNHLLLARAFQYQKKWDKAGEQAEAALIMDSNNIVANLESLALAIKQSADTNFMTQAYERFARTQAVYEKLPDNIEKQTRWRELTLNVAILYGMENTPDDQKAANAWVDAVLKNNPNDQQARDISKALN